MLDQFSISPCLSVTDPEADQEASEMLTNNAQNLMGAVSEVLYATEAATIRVPQADREELGLQWVKRNWKASARENRNQLNLIML